MADYVTSNGNIQMMIRDTGYTVEYWVLTDSRTYAHQQRWSGTGHGVETFDMNNRGSWQFVGSVDIGGSQNVDFTMYSSGIGFPTYTYTVYINRASRPNAPYPPSFTDVVDTAVTATTYPNGDNGAGIDAYEVWLSWDPNNYAWQGAPYQGYRFTGLSPGGVYYAWARAHNAQGWSDFSGRSQVTLLRPPFAPTPVTFSALTDHSVHTTFRGGYDGGSAAIEYQIAYGSDPSTPQTYVSNNSGDLDISSLTPLITYYFWARGRNQYGWGDWSARTAIRMQGPPDAPSSPVLSGAKQTSIVANFSPNADNGSPITGYQVAHATSPDGPFTYFDIPGPGLVDGLVPGTLQYFGVRAKNAYGWGPLSALVTAKTIAGAWVNVNGVWTPAIPYVNVAGVWKPALVWGKIAGVWKETG